METEEETVLLDDAEAELLQHLLEKVESAWVQVGIGQADAQVFNLDHQHMHVVGADVVLDQQFAA